MRKVPDSGAIWGDLSVLVAEVPVASVGGRLLTACSRLSPAKPG
jgi:hypothetical protein